MRQDIAGAANQELIGNRYRVEAELGRGGMARVVRALDERSGQRCALKQLIDLDKHGATLRAMFEREYHTLAELEHPHIVRVFDFGVDDHEQPYYTMELLEGVDVREVLQSGPMPVREACTIMRDCASALALIHSRRMVHRDVSPRNVWCGPSGRAKLIDFGTLVPMGAETRIAGTPPFMPPEAFYGQPLDARCDLFALGALGYLLLTQRNAFPARVLSELPELWQGRPERPDVLDPSLPRALCDLVMALLSLESRARPASAAEVFERLTAIAELPVERAPELAQAFLTSPKLIGRDAARGALGKRLRHARAGRGYSAALVAKAGMGRTRMLATVVLQSKLAGATAVSVGATAVGSGLLSLATAIVEGLIDQQPMAAELAAELGPLLGHLSPAIRRALGEPELTALAAHERTRKLSAAIIAFVERACADRCVVLAVDDLHRVDSASLWLLGKLSLSARERRLLIVTTCDEAALADAPPALARLVAQRRRIALPPLDAAQTHALLESLFDDIPGLEPAARFLYELSRGCPQTCMHYAQYLVDRGIARYEAGQWRLPATLETHGLPHSVGAILEQKVAALSHDARMLALGLALARDRTRASWQPETHVLIGDFPKLLDTPEPARAYAALDELLCAALLQDRNGYYVLAQSALSDVLVHATDPESMRRMHARLAAVFNDAGNAGSWLQVRHLLLAEEYDAARQCAVRLGEYYGNATADWGAMRLSLMAECGNGVLAHQPATHTAPRDAVLLRRPLLLICSVFDWKLADHGAAHLAQLRQDCGLADWDALEALPLPQRIGECLQRAQRAYDAADANARGLSPLEALRELAGCALSLSGAFVNSHNVAEARVTASILTPFATLAPPLQLLAELCQLGLERVTGREVGDKILDRGVTGLAAAEGIPDTLRQGGAGVHAHIQAVEDARRGRDRGISLMDLIASAVGDDMFLVVHGRWLGHAFCGNAAAAKRLHKQLELITEDDVWRRRAYMFAEAELHALCGDLRGLSRVSEQLEELAQRFAGWLPWSIWARAEQLRLRGDLAQAELEQRCALELARPGEHRAWLRIAPSHAELCLALGQVERALEEAGAIVETVGALGLDRSASVEGERIRALAHSRRDEHAAASAALARAVATADALAIGGLVRARLLHAEARLTLARGEAATAPLAQMWKLLEHADAPALIRAYQALREENSRVVRGSDAASVSHISIKEVSAYASMLSTLQTRFDVMDSAQQRAEHALELLISDSGSHGGYLFLLNREGLFVAAKQAVANDNAVLSVATQYLHTQLDEVQTVTATDTSTELLGTQLTGLPNSSPGLVPVPLTEHSDQGELLLGLALLAAGTSSRAPRATLVRALSRCLHVAGDSLAQLRG